MKIWAEDQEKAMGENQAKQRILFVDDDPSVLEGLQRMLRPLRHEWDMLFCPSGEKALQVLESKPFDVIVSDMRMPGMDGAQLLQEVKNRYPTVVRIILSGHSDKTMILNSVRTAHQYLSKPCDPKTLKTTVSRACALQSLSKNMEIRALITTTGAVPALPSLYAELMEEINSPEFSLKRIAAVISQDVGMTAKILQLVNSAFFGLPRKISSPEEAVNYLGVETIKSLTLTIQVFSQFKIDLPLFSHEALLAHCLETGTLARRIAEAGGLDKETADITFLASMLHDVGKLILAVNIPERFTECLGQAKKGNKRQDVVEMEHFGSSHAEVGAYLLGLWGLPDLLVEAVAFHHRPSDCPAQSFNTLTVVHVADALLRKEDSRGIIGQRPKVDTRYLEECGLGEKLAEWEDIALQAREGE